MKSAVIMTVSLSQSCFINRGPWLSQSGVDRLWTCDGSGQLMRFTARHTFPCCSVFLFSLCFNIFSLMWLSGGRKAPLLVPPRPCSLGKFWGHLKPWESLWGDSDCGRLYSLIERCGARVYLISTFHGDVVSPTSHHSMYAEDKPMAAFFFFFKAFYSQVVTPRERRCLTAALDFLHVWQMVSKLDIIK